MKKYFILVWAGVLSGCTLLGPKIPTQLEKPDTLQHKGKRYHLKLEHDLGPMARYVYFEKKETSTNWKSAVELLLDRNDEKRTLAERIALRERVYKNNGVEHFHLYEKDNALYASIIYLPSEQHNNWQVDVAKGMNVADCGFVQYQYSLKIPKTKKMINMGKEKLISYLKKYVIDKEIKRLADAEWKWQCRKQESLGE